MDSGLCAFNFSFSSHLLGFWELIKQTTPIKKCTDMLLSQLTEPVQRGNLSKIMLKLNMWFQRLNTKRNVKYLPSFPLFSKIRWTWSLYVVVLQRTAKKCTKVNNARAYLLFFSLNILLGDVLVAVVLVVCYISLINKPERQRQRLLLLFKRGLHFFAHFFVILYKDHNFLCKTARFRRCLTNTF